MSKIKDLYYDLLNQQEYDEYCEEYSDYLDEIANDYIEERMIYNE